MSDESIIEGIFEQAPEMITKDSFKIAFEKLSLDTLKLVAESGPSDYKDHPTRKFKEWQKMGPGGF